MQGEKTGEREKEKRLIAKQQVSMLPQRSIQDLKSTKEYVLLKASSSSTMPKHAKELEEEKRGNQIRVKEREQISI